MLGLGIVSKEPEHAINGMTGYRMRSWCRIVPVLTIAMTLVVTTSGASEQVAFMSYHAGAPFIVDEEAQLGLTYDLAELLSRNSDGRYQFQVTIWPRNRLNDILNRGEEVVVPWTQPVWFKDPQRERYLWTDGYFPGRNAIISSVSRPIDYAGPTSLQGLTLAGLRGGRWPQFEQLIKQGKIERVDTSNYLAAMQMVALGRADAALVLRAGALHLVDAPGQALHALDQSGQGRCVALAR